MIVTLQEMFMELLGAQNAADHAEFESRRLTDRKREIALRFSTLLPDGESINVLVDGSVFIIRKRGYNTSIHPIELFDLTSISTINELNKDTSNV